MSLHKSSVLVMLIFLVSIPLAIAADLSDIIPGDEKEPIVVIIRQGSTAISDSLASKSAPEKSATLVTATNTALKDVTYPYAVSGTSIAILKYRCTSEMCGYWISATRGGKEVATNSTVWISPPPYIVVVSKTCYLDLDAKLITSCDITDGKSIRPSLISYTVEEDPKRASEMVLRDYVDRQPFGKAITGTEA